MLCLVFLVIILEKEEVLLWRRKVFGIKSGRVVIFGSAISRQSNLDAKLERKSRDFQGWIDEIAREYKHIHP